jgi:hypothetical protein
MSDLKFLASYSGESTEELIRMGSDYRIDSLVMAFEEALGRKAYRLGDAALSWPERVVLAVEALEREVNNGGYAQFFINSSKEYASMIVEALHAIDCRDTAEVTEVAIDSLRTRGETSEAAIDEAMNSADGNTSDQLSTCDDRYYEVGEDIAGKLFAFIMRNKREISIP